MNIITESFNEKWDEVAAMTKNGPFITGRPVIHTSGSMITVKEGFWRQHGVSIASILLGLMTLIAVVYNLSKESNHGDMVTFLILLLGALFVFFGVIRILSVRRICWNENAECLYVHYGWLWNRHIFQVPRQSFYIKMSVAGVKKWSSHFYHGDTILLLELKNRSSVSPIHLLANSSRKAIGHIADILSVNHFNIEDSTLAWETVSDGKTISFSKTGIGRTSMLLPYMRVYCCSKQGQLIVAGMRYSMMRF